LLIIVLGLLIYLWFTVNKDKTSDLIVNQDQDQDQELVDQIEAVLAKVDPSEKELFRQKIEYYIKMQRSVFHGAFEFLLVPDALSAITLPPPPNSNEEDSKSYLAVKPDPATLPLSAVKNDTINSLSFKNKTYGDYLNNSVYRLQLQQLYLELKQLVIYYNELYKRDPLSVRIENVFEADLLPAIVPNKPEIHSVYPSWRAVEGFATVEIMTRAEPAKADFYKKIGEDFVQRGMVYGFYGQSDIAVSRSLVQQYFLLLDKNIINNTSVIFSAK